MTTEEIHNLFANLGEIFHIKNQVFFLLIAPFHFLVKNFDI